MIQLFNNNYKWNSIGLAIVRIIVGLLLAYHGLEVLNTDLMKEYTQWEVFKGPNGGLLVYAGKLTELFSGIFIFLGFLTRIGSLLAIGAMSFITFFVGQGKFWYEDQHPFMFVLFGLLFLFTGPGVWSVDAIIFKEKTTDKKGDIVE